jgi:hypothetical protein
MAKRSNSQIVTLRIERSLLEHPGGFVMYVLPNVCAQLLKTEDRLGLCAKDSGDLLYDCLQDEEAERAIAKVSLMLSGRSCLRFECARSTTSSLSRSKK